MSNEEKKVIYTTISASGSDLSYECLNCHEYQDKPFSHCPMCGMTRDEWFSIGEYAITKEMSLSEAIDLFKKDNIGAIALIDNEYSHNFVAWCNSNNISVIDNIRHPKHYNMGTIEVIEVIEDWDLGFHIGNAVKYLARAKHKDNEVQDLRKAIYYIKRKIRNIARANIKKNITDVE